MEKRRYNRFPVHNVLADISDGAGFYLGSVTNVSEVGLMLEDLPIKIDEQASAFTIVVTAEGRNFKLLARPKWATKYAMSKGIGMRLVDSTPDWTRYVRAFQTDKTDIWGTEPR